MDALTLRLHSLPQELYDDIYNEVFTATRRRIDIGLSYGPPHLLSINSASRIQFAKSYYNNSIFVFDNDVILHRWLRGIAAVGNLHLLEEVRFLNRSLMDPCVSRFQVRFNVGSQQHLKSTVKRATFNELYRLWRNLKLDGIELPKQVLKVERYFRNDAGEEDVVVCYDSSI